MSRFVVALSCEARPLVRRYALKTDPRESAYRIYRSEEHDLVISGVGRVAAGAAVAYLAARSERPGPWLNVGVAGHASRSVGEMVLAEKIEEPGTGSSYYPRRHVEIGVPASRLITVDRVETEYAEEAAYDMEGSGFWATANRFEPAELVHCLKIVSDGPGDSLRHLDADRIEDLVEARLEAVDQVRRALEELAGSRPGRYELDPAPFLEVHRLSATQRRRLERLVERWAVLHRQPFSKAAGQALAAFAETPPNETATAALDRLERRLDETPMRLGAGPDCG